MTCENCAHGKMCAYRKSSEHITNIENHCDLFQDSDRTFSVLRSIGEPIWIIDRGRIIETIVYKIRMLIECEDDRIEKGRMDIRQQIFVQEDSGKVHEVLPKHIGATAFLSFEGAVKTMVDQSNSGENIRFNMFKDYIRELHGIEGLREMTDAEILDQYIKIRSGINEAWADIYQEESPRTDADLIGFWVHGINGNCHPDADEFIAEAYIRPEYRREGIMSETISNWIKTYGGKICLFALSKNEVAKKFWLSLFEKIGYEPYQLSKVADDMDGHLIQFGFRPKESAK